jgi:hypothetical protein
VGWVGETFGARWTLIGGGAITMLGVLVAVAVFARSKGLVTAQSRAEVRERVMAGSRSLLHRSPA